jgi:5-methylcytosine-specific restriction endonuclease McrA
LKGNHPRLPHPPRDPQQRADKFIATMKAKRHSNFESLGWECRRRCVIESQEGRCGKCQLSEWLGQPIPLEVDHINGDRTDHRRENLEAICPNCHAQTPTWRGRGLKILNDGPRLNSYTDEEILKLLIEHKTPSNLLRALGMSPRGGNYRRVNKALLSTLQRV